MRSMLLLLLGLTLFAGCASHTQFGGNRFGATFDWGNADESYAEPYSFQPPDPMTY